MVSQKERGFPVLFNSTRFVVLCLTTACLSFCLANPLILNFTVICMEDIVPQGMEKSGNNTTEVHWLHDSALRNLLFSGSAIGNLIGTFPITALIQRFGTRTLIMVYGLTSAAATAAFPFAVATGFYPLIFATRIAQGFAMAFTMSAAGAVCVTWSPIKEFGLYLSILSMHFQFSAIFTMSVSGAFCVSSIGWRGVFFLQAGLTFLLFALFFYFYEDEPGAHRKVSIKELSRIEKGKENENKRGSVPYLAICTSPTIIGVWLSSIGGNLGFQILLQFGPTYLNKVLNFAVASTGFATALPYILSATLKAVSGPLSDNATCISEKARIILFASISQGFMAVCYLVMAFVSDPLISQICYTAAIVFSGLNIIGALRCAQLVARQYMPFVMSVFNGITCVITLVLPPFVAEVADENTPEQWSLIFQSAAAVIVATNILFPFVASDQAAPWTRSDYQNKNKVSDEVKTILAMKLVLLTIMLLANLAAGQLFTFQVWVSFEGTITCNDPEHKGSGFVQVRLEEVDGFFSGAATQPITYQNFNMHPGQTSVNYTISGYAKDDWPQTTVEPRLRIFHTCGGGPLKKLCLEYEDIDSNNSHIKANVDLNMPNPPGCS